MPPLTRLRARLMQKISFTEPKHKAISVIDGFYTLSELAQIMDELHSLHAVAKIGIFSNSGVSLDEKGEPKQRSSSLFLDRFYGNQREFSKILSLNRKVFNGRIIKKLINSNVFYKHLNYCNLDNTLINFYRQGDYYKAHMDDSCFTAITFFELEKFNGGELFFPEYELTIEALHNRVVIFPGFISHASKKVANGIRVSMAQFINYRMR